MTNQEHILENRLQEIKEHPERHKHTFDELYKCCRFQKRLDSRLLEAHQRYAPVGTNGGVNCDVTEGPCACGAWHKREETK